MVLRKVKDFLLNNQQSDRSASGSHRNIIANDSVYNSRFNYANNHIKTSKYSIFTFIPLNFFEQFQRLANFYFLCLLILQLIPAISSLSPITTILPLIGVLMLTAIKDGYDDIQRHKTDKQVNSRESTVLRKGHLIQEKWHRVQVGDVILMENNQFIAADTLLLSSFNPNGLCYIETAELDGETNLKARQCPELTNDALNCNRTALGQFDGYIVCENPNNNLCRFEGTLEWNGKKVFLDNDNILLRGAILRNTGWCYGVVIFAGKDTKLMQNSGATKLKRTSIDRLLNFIILGIVLCLVVICLLCTMASGIWESYIGQNFRIYLPWPAIVPESVVSGATLIAFLVFFSYAIVLNTVVPISLYVSVEVIRFVMSYLINLDAQMYDEVSGTSASARTTTLNEELGQIQYIFTDKTGTLTQNVMTFNKCSIFGVNYGEIMDDMTGEQIDTEMANYRVDFSYNPYCEPNFEFYDVSLVDVVKRGKDENVKRFFRTLALCHTVMPEVSELGELEYQAQSPDENALVSAARNFGFVFIRRTPSSITILVDQQEEVYELLTILDFNNVRKRMSVIVKRDDKIYLFCKGADTVIFPRLSTTIHSDIASLTINHLNKFAAEGLRTLALAYRELTESEYAHWHYVNQEAVLSLSPDRQERVDASYEMVERDLIVVGATAIEDKLQIGVPETLSKLMCAGINIWMLTGDQQDTAINIGYSCQLLTDDLHNDIPFIVDAQTQEDVQLQLISIRNEICSTQRDGSVFSARKPDSSLNNHRSSDENGTMQFGRYEKHQELTNKCFDSVTKSNRVSPELEHHKMDTIMARNGIRGIEGDSVEKDGFVALDVDDNINNVNDTTYFALVVNGSSLVHALTSDLEKLFLSVAEKCTSVICCRTTPLQKAMVVELVKKYKKAVTLAVGDGANDVSMIKTAHIGVGISGHEGMQAVLASDYSIAQFRFLERLLLVHGRWSYFRICKFLRYFFYKNFAFTLCHFWYAFFCGFSAQTALEPAFIAVYNVFYTSMPVFTLGVLEQDVNADMSLRFPKLYTPGQTCRLFNRSQFVKSATQGMFASGVLFFAVYGAFGCKLKEDGTTISDFMIFSTIISINLIVAVTAEIVLDTSFWTVYNHITIWGSVATYFILQLVYNQIFHGIYIGTLYAALTDLTFWLTCVLSTVVLVVPVLAFRLFCSLVSPTLAQKVRLLQLSESKAMKKELKVAAKQQNGGQSRKTSWRPYSGGSKTSSSTGRKRSARSGYAFAHHEGFGGLITSGSMMRERIKGIGSSSDTHSGNKSHRFGKPFEDGMNSIKSYMSKASGRLSSLSNIVEATATGSLSSSGRKSPNRYKISRKSAHSDLNIQRGQSPTAPAAIDKQGKDKKYSSLSSDLQLVHRNHDDLGVDRFTGNELACSNLELTLKNRDLIVAYEGGSRTGAAQSFESVVSGRNVGPNQEVIAPNYDHETEDS